VSQIIKAIIVDDEALSREALRNALAGYNDVELLQECPNGIEGLQAIQKHSPDVVFLDIQMPKLDGFDVVELLGDNEPVIVFVTAHDDYALQAFEAQAMDYLLKPVNKERLKKTIERLRIRLQSSNDQSLKKLVVSHQNQQAPLTRILIRDGMNVSIIPTEDIIYIEASDDYVTLFTLRESYLKYDRMSRLEQMLDPQYFCRIHRSYILNIKYLQKIEPYTKDSRVAILNNGVSLPISRSGYSRLNNFL